MTPDGAAERRLRIRAGLYLNTGHGTLGWTMACGSGSVIADIVSGKVPDIGISDLGPRRYQ